jgi:dUTP pyrophosphatase
MKIKPLYPESKLPTKATDGSIGHDLYAHTVSKGAYYIEYGTGIAIQPPEGYYAIIVPRSSISNRGLSLANSLGIIDPDFIGELKLRFYEIDSKYDHYEVGEKIGQLILLPIIPINIEIVDSLKETERGSGGFGSTGQK